MTSSQNQEQPQKDNEYDIEYYSGQVIDLEEKTGKSKINWKKILILIIILTMIIGVLVFLVYNNYMKSVYPIKYQELVEQYADEYDFDYSLIYAVIHTESSFNEKAVSHAGAIGLMQVTENAFEWAQYRNGQSPKLGVDQLYDPQVNVEYGVYYLSLMRELFPQSDITTLLAAYNAGQGNVANWLKDKKYSSDGINLDVQKIPYFETKNYVVKIPQTQKIYQRLYKID